MNWLTVKAVGSTTWLVFSYVVTALAEVAVAAISIAVIKAVFQHYLRKGGRDILSATLGEKTA